MNTKIKYILVGLLILFSIYYFFRYKRVFRSIYDPKRPKLTLNQVLKPGSFKTGDLVLFSHERDNKIRDGLCTFYLSMIGSEWTHVGIIIEINNRYYVAESTAKEHKKYGFSDLNLLSQRLETYKGRIAFRKLNKNLDIFNERKLINYVLQTRGIPFEDNLVIHVVHDCFLKGFDFGQKLFRLAFGKPSRKGFFCTEYVRKVMKKAGIMSPFDKENCDHCSLPFHFNDNYKTLNTHMAKKSI